MPELPEVETVVRALRPLLVGQTITGMDSDWPNQIVTPDLASLQERIAGGRIEAINRRGKYLLFSLGNNETLIIHLKMTGHLSVVSASEARNPYVHAVFQLGGGKELRFRDMRKFGRIYLVRDPDDVLGKLGPEPLEADFTPAWLHRNLSRRRRVLKPLLLDQTFVAGIGNIYADEALYRAAIDPRRHSHTVNPTEAEALHQAIRTVLKLGIAQEGASIDGAYRKPDGSPGTMQDEVLVYGRAGEPCARCGTPLERIILGGRSTHLCPACQS
ncbi:MAG: bifunctional DNA-formamidopyrimidine glycosylase/DNA-(apurinic or apyrimidinic site) lyase [Candidatus Promineifilaceae bacterium]|nr:bifunctional DNA-formamidopyrimidine glycosylase/DNA-(apurinic or apyrimidinic site) lyase [Candidatus Promineifilaceae bacterium]